MSNKLYTDKSIESLSPLEFTRLRPGVYAGDTTYSSQLLIEIVSNSIDEFRLGHGNVIDVEVNDTTMTVRDYGQGFLVNSLREDGKTVLEAAFSVLNTSGKYREDGTYEGTSLGSFGIGSKITTYLSNSLTVKTWRDGQTETIDFVEGEFSKRSIGTDKSEPTGTQVVWNPSAEFFTNTSVDLGAIRRLFKTTVCLCPGLTINLTVGGKKEVYYSTNGLNDLVDEATEGKEILKNRFVVSGIEGKNKVDLAMTFTNGYSSTIVPYVNTGLTESGLHITQLKTCITKEFNKFFREKKWLKDKDDNLSGDEIQEGMYLVFNLTSSNVSYDAQVKSRITKIDTKFFIQTVAENLSIWLSNNEKEVKALADKAIAARKAKEAAKRARDKVRGVAEKKAVLKLPSKLTDCYSKDRKDCEIFIVEGDSAGGGMKLARDNEYQAVLPVRGKILNCWKAGLDKVLANAEVRDMINAFGLDIDPKTGKVKFNEANLRYGKIIISADADVDGAHIQSLFYTFIWHFAPELIEKGYIYATVPPLYKVTKGKQYHYLQDEAALESFKAQYPNSALTVNRMKGLGEMDADELEMSLLSPKTRTLKQVCSDNSVQSTELFEHLMGTAVGYRKKFIEDHSQEVEINV